MDIEKILRIIAIVISVLGLLSVIIFNIIECIRSHKHWKKLDAELNLYLVSLKKEHGMLHNIHICNDKLDELLSASVENKKPTYVSGVNDAVRIFKTYFNDYCGDDNGE